MYVNHCHGTQTVRTKLMGREILVRVCVHVCVCVCACVRVRGTVLLRWLGECRAGWALIEARNNIKANLSFLCLCLPHPPLHSVTHWLPHLSHHLEPVSVSSSLFVWLPLHCLSSELALSSYHLQCTYILYVSFFMNFHKENCIRYKGPSLCSNRNVHRSR